MPAQQAIEQEKTIIHAAPPPPTVDRFQLPDMHDKGPWMTKRLMERWPHIHPRFVSGWLAGMMAQNEWYFVQTKNAVLLAQRITEGLNQEPSVRLWFALMRDPDSADQIEDGAVLYRAMMKWASDIGALRILDLDHFTDLPKAEIKKCFGGKINLEDTMYARIAK